PNRVIRARSRAGGLTVCDRIRRSIEASCKSNGLVYASAAPAGSCIACALRMIVSLTICNSSVGRDVTVPRVAAGVARFKLRSTVGWTDSLTSVSVLLVKLARSRGAREHGAAVVSRLDAQQPLVGR